MTKFIYKNEIWESDICVCPPSVSAEIIIMLTNGEINRPTAKKLFKIMVENWTAFLNEAIAKGQYEKVTL
jgi:hypothetical protein